MTSYRTRKFTYVEAWGLFCDNTERWLYESQGFYRIAFQTEEEAQYLASLIMRDVELVNPVASRLITDATIKQVLEFHRFTFEGATGLLARHLVEVHGVDESKVSEWDGGMSQGDWIALDNIHQQVHKDMET